ncbi:MAG: sigma-54-dependent Fis family transcriptional regulator [Planctomycetes bacterium]|nr:sigma-54-dependent Fis family transcriptional regulator [Planctomycetota bacterium]
MRVLLAEDEKTIAITLADDLRERGHEVTVAEDGREAKEEFKRKYFDAVITDIKMPGLSGLDLLREVKGQSPGTEVIVITGVGTVETAVQAMKLGAYDFLTKPFLNEEVLHLLEKIEQVQNLREENLRLKQELEGRYRFERLVGKSKPMQEVYRLVETVAPRDSNVLIVGESGTGKELIAHAIHHNSRRKEKVLVCVSCAVFSENLLEDELFGHEKGAYTDAREKKIGRFELAHGGTIFLDDIDDMTLATQVKLLRVLQERRFERLGGTAPIEIDIRVIAATKVDLEVLVQEKKFREDLFFRLNVVPVRLPPLREREGDVPLLVQHFVDRFAGGRKYHLAPEILADMCSYPWPGNVRELENSVERAIALAGDSDELDRRNLLRPALSERLRLAGNGPPSGPDLRPLRDVLAEAERLHIKNVLKQSSGHRARSAEVLGISRKSLWEKMKEYQLE